MTNNIEVLRGLVAEWRADRPIITGGGYEEYRAAQNECADELEAALAAMGGQGEDASLRAALEAILPYAQHADSCGDMDAYNNVAMPRCDCGLDLAKSAAYDALAAPQQPEARGGGEVADLISVQRYFPSKPTGPGWEMTADDRGDWVLWSDVVEALSHRSATVERYEPSGLDSCQPISWLVKSEGRRFCVDSEATAKWWAARIISPPPSAVPEGWKLVPVEATEAMRQAHAMYGDTSDWWNAMLAAAPEPNKENEQ